MTLKVNGELLFQLLLFYTEKLQASERQMRHLVHMSAKGCLVNALLKLRVPFGTNENGYVNIYLGHQDSTSYANITQESVFHLLTERERKKYIRTDSKNSAIADHETLLRFPKK